MTSGANRLKAKINKTKEQSQYQPSFVTFTSSTNNRLRRRGRTTGEFEIKEVAKQYLT